MGLVTREHAAEFAAESYDHDGTWCYPDQSHAAITSLAKTVMALYDLRDSLLSDAQQLAGGIGPRDRVIETQRECIDRLRDGWSYGDLAASYSHGTRWPGGWCWSRGSWGGPYERVEATPEQQAVMAG